MQWPVHSEEGQELDPENEVRNMYKVYVKI